MLGRRSDARFVLANGAGTLQVLSDVVVMSTAAELLAISHHPVAVGDALMVEMMVDGQVQRVAVCVEESQPMLVAASIRHRLRLSRVDSPDPAAVAKRRHSEQATESVESCGTATPGPIDSDQPCAHPELQRLGLPDGDDASDSPQ
jgi:hypothetical protein